MSQLISLGRGFSLSKQFFAIAIFILGACLFLNTSRGSAISLAESDLSSGRSQIFHSNSASNGGLSYSTALANNAPIAVDDTYAPPGRFQPLSVTAPGILLNDTDSDGDVLTAQLVTGPSHGTLKLQSNGAFTYTWSPGWAAADTFTYRVTDGQALSNVATVSIQMFPNTPPVAADDFFTVGLGQTLTINPPGVLLNDTDADGDRLLAHIYRYPQHGSVNFNLYGGFTYSPQAGFIGDDNFTYRTDDGTAARSNEATVTITVSAAPSPTPTPTPNATIVQFSVDNFEIVEDTTYLDLSVTRSGDLTVTSTVEFFTVDGSALQSTDYTLSCGLVVFASGEGLKTIRVLVSEDAYVEGGESLSVTLRNPIGAVLGTPSTSSVQILDDDLNAPSENPIDTSVGLVTQQYHDYLNREGDLGGIAYWAHEIESCGNDQVCINERRTRVADAFFVESEFQNKGAFLQRVYKAAFDSPPSYDSYMQDLGQLNGASPLQYQAEFVERFVSTAEFNSRYPSTQTPEKYVDSLNANTGNSLIKSERDALVSGLINRSQTRATVLRAIAEHPLFVERRYNPNFVLSLYFSLLRRDADAGGFQFWLEKIELFPPHSGEGQHSLFCAFLTSREYQMRFSSVVTRSNVDCGR